MSNLSSPYATGGGGPNFESRVGSYYLACALTQSIPRGLPDAITREVSFQALYQGESLDDLVIRADRLDQEAKLALQVKRDLVFGPADSRFIDVMRRCWVTFLSADFRDGVDRFGIALGLYGKTIDEHYQTVLAWARVATNGDNFVQRVQTPGLSHHKQRDFLGLIRSQLDLHSGRTLTADELWRFCRSFVLLHFDFQNEGSRDAAYLTMQLQFTTDVNGAHSATDLLRELDSLAETAGRTAGTESTATLREKLSARFPIRASADVRRDLNALKQHAALILSNIESDIEGISLPRTAVLDALSAAVSDYEIVGIVGPPGVGKSAVLKMLLDAQAVHGQPLVFAADRFEGQGLDSFVANVGLRSPLREILFSAAASPVPLVLIDGIDRCVTKGGQQIVNDLLRIVQEINAGRARPWRIVFTVREQNVQSVLQWTAFPRGASPHVVTVTDINDADANVIAERVPSLRPLFAQAHLRPLTRNLFMVRRLTDRRIRENLTHSSAVTEIDLATVWWEHVVSDGTAAGIARQQTLLRLAAAIVEGNDEAILHLQADALSSLRFDRILLTEPHRDVARFTHDIFEDWALLRLVDIRRAGLTSFLRAVRETFRLQRAVRLFACSLLERGEGTLWRELLSTLESHQSLAPRWCHAFLSSPLLSVRANDLLDQIRDVLFADNGRRLSQLLTAARTVDVSPDLSSFPGLGFLTPMPDELLSLLLHQPVPHWAVWRPLVGWLVGNADELPPPTRPQVVRVLELWQVHTDPADRQMVRGAIYRGEIADLALSWVGGHAEVPAGSGEKEIADTAERLRRIILRSGDVRPDLTADVLMRIANGWNEDAIRQMLGESRNAAAFIASRYVNAVLRLLLPKDKASDREWGSRAVLSDYGFRHDHDFYPAAHAQGPFIWLFRENESEALRLVHALANTAIDRWQEFQTDQWDFVGTPVPLTLQFPWGEQEFWGGPTEYMWFRADGMGPNCVVSGLMALEFWMEEQLAAGRDAAELFETVLRGSRCIAVPALCLGVTLASPAKCLRAALPIVSSSLMWLLDIRRVVRDQRPSINYDPLGKHEAMNFARAERDKRPQRKLDVRNLAPAYLFREDDQLREEFQRSLAAFAVDVPVLYEEQRSNAEALEDVRRELERYQCLAVLGNWRLTKEGDVIYLAVEPPLAIAEQDAAALQRIAEQSSWVRLHVWAQNTLEKKIVDDGLSLDDALKECQRLYSPELFATPMQFGDGLESFRQQAVAAGAAALVVAAGEWVRGNGLDWCRAVFLEAAAMPHGDVEESTQRAAIPWHPRVSAIQGLTALVRDGVATQAERELLLTLATEWNSDFLNALSRGLPDIWSADRELGWALFAFLVHRTNLLPPRPGNDGEQRAANSAALLETHRDSFRRNERIALPSVADAGDRLDCYLFQDSCFGLPLEKVITDDRARPQLLQLFRGLCHWTLGRNRASKTIYKQALDEWNAFFVRSLARLAGSLSDEDYQDVVLPFLKDSWTEPLELVPDYLGGYLGWQLAAVEPLPPSAVNRWKDLTRWLLASSHLSTYASQQYPQRATEEAIAWLVFTASGDNYFKVIWPHAGLFADTIDAFVTVLGKDWRAYRRLLVFLARFYDRFPVSALVRWLCGNAIQPPPAEFFTRSDLGLRTAQVLQSLWSASRDRILDGAEIEERYALLVDQLLGAGVPLAKILADGLAQRT